MKIGAAIPAYRDIAGVRSCLVSLARFAPSVQESTVVVDDSGDGRIVTGLKSAFPTVRWIAHERNLGFGTSANDAVRACDADIIVLLNDDTELRDDPTPYLSAAFKDERLFAATFQSFTRDGRFREGAKRLVWPMGFPRVLHNPCDQSAAQDGVVESAYAVGGHAAFRRSLFLELGGFDELFAPFYWEDVDLGMRARKAGYRIIYLPECQVIHDGASAIRSQHDAEYLREITMRNRLLFAWRHLSGSGRALHQISLAYHLVRSLHPAHRSFRRAYAAAQERHRAAGGHE